MIFCMMLPRQVTTSSNSGYALTTLNSLRGSKEATDCVCNAGSAGLDGGACSLCEAGGYSVATRLTAGSQCALVALRPRSQLLMPPHPSPPVLLALPTRCHLPAVQLPVPAPTTLDHDSPPATGLASPAAGTATRTARETVRALGAGSEG